MERVQKGQYYYVVNYITLVEVRTEEYAAEDDLAFEVGNYFLTEKEAEFAAERLRRFWSNGMRMPAIKITSDEFFSNIALGDASINS